jgi:hypothetical protein
MANERLDILINARNQASGALNQVKGELGGLKESTRGLGSAGALMGGVLAGGLAIVGSAAIRAAGDMAQLGAQTEMLRASLQSLATQNGTTAQEMVSALQGASRGMIAEQDLILGANRALLLGVAKNSEEMVALMQVATVRGRAMGISVTQAFNDIVTGLGRGSALILDNLGIVVDAEGTNRAYAASLGKTASQLTEVEKKQALVNKVLEEGQKLAAQSATDTQLQADSYARLSAAWKDFRSNVGQGIGTVASPIAAGTAYALEAINGTLDTRAALIKQLIVLQNNLNDIDVDTHPELAQEYKRLEGAIAAVTSEYNQLGPEISSIYGAQIKEAAATKEAAAAYRDKANAVRDAIMEQAREQGGQIRTQLLGLSGDLGAQKALTLNESLNKQLLERTAIYQQYGMSAERIEFENAAWIDKQVGGLRDQISAQEKLATATGSTHVATQALNAEYEKLRGSVESVLQSSLDPGVGVNPDDLLPRPDAINENARRLADIAVNGFTDQSWLEQFRAQAPDIAQALQEAADPKAAAAQLLKDFQDGLVPQLIDKEAAKEKVKRMITGEATMAELATEIAQELSAEMGISLAQATQATNSALGTGGAAQLGDSGGVASAAFGDGFKGEPVGGAFVDGLTAAIIAKYGSLEASGQSAGATWKTGFLATTTVDIPVALVMALTTLITPEVQKALDAQKSRTGAY